MAAFADGAKDDREQLQGRYSAEIQHQAGTLDAVQVMSLVKNT